MKYFYLIIIYLITTLRLISNTIAVLPSQNVTLEVQNKETYIKQLGRDIIAILSNQKRYEIIEQEKIDEIYKELQKSQTGLVDQEQAAKLGYLKGIKYFIFYDIQREDETYTGNFRIVQTETGTIIGAGRDTGNYEYLLDSLTQKIIHQLDIYLNLDNPLSPYTVLLKLNKEKAVYKVGETIKISFKVISHNKIKSNKVYIQLFSIDANGKMTLIYPNKYSGFDPIELEKEYEFPSSNDDFEWELTPPVGTEYIQAFVSEQPIDILGVLQKAKRELFPESNKDGNSIITYRGIQTKLKKDKIKNWSTMRIAYELME